MSAVEETHSPFHLLLHEIGKELKMGDVRYMKYLLQGHINKETLEPLKAGHELIDLLRKRRLVSEKKLAFLRKLLIEANCLKLVNLVDDFKEKFTPVATVGERQEAERASRLNNRRETLLRMIERVENEICVCEDANTEFTNQIKEHEVQIQANSQTLVEGEDDIHFLKNRITEHEAEIESFERKLETVRFFLKKHEVEIDTFKQKLQENKSSASIKRNLKEKQEEYEKAKKNEGELIAKHQRAMDLIRATYVEIRHKTQHLISLEDDIHNLQMDIRAIKQGVRKNQRTSAELHNKLENLSTEVEQTKRVKPLTPYSRSQARVSLRGSAENWRLSKSPLGYKVLDYGEISERESTVIGRKGKRAYPPQFQFPISVAADGLGNVYVADYGNARIQVFDVDGNIAREPLNMGGKCRPCALAVSSRGDLVVADCQILRVLSKKGDILRPILPVYGKNDRRPELSSVAFDVQGNIYVADKANHRIQKFSFDGNFLCFIGGHHDLHCPVGVIVRRNGDVIVTELENHCLKIFSQVDLGLSITIGSMGVGMGKFLCPRGLALDHFENIMVADSKNHRIQVISPTGESIGAFGRLGSDLGCLDTPYDVAMDTNGKVIVADAKNHRLQVFTRLVPVHAEPTQMDDECYESPTIEQDDNEISEGLGKIHVANDTGNTNGKGNANPCTDGQSNAHFVYSGAESDTNQGQITEGTITIIASDDNHNNNALNSNNAPKESDPITRELLKGR